MSRDGCQTQCVNGKLMLTCPLAPAIERDLGLCNQTIPTAPAKFGTKARYVRDMVLIGQTQEKMNQELVAAELRMNPPKPIPRKTNPVYGVAGMVGIAQARAKPAQMRRDAFAHID